MHAARLGPYGPRVNTFFSVGVLSGLAAFAMLAACGSSSSNSNPENKTEIENIEAGLAPDATPLDQTAIPSLTANSWQWVPIDGSMCRDGSPTGIGVYSNPNSKNLEIFLEGGGACFNADTCALNPSAYGETNFTNRFGNDAAQTGILSNTDTQNPTADWNKVYVPFCTGDIHAGNAPNSMVPGVGVQQFVGYTNVTRALARLVPTFPGLQKVLLTGISAGGFGAAVNYDQTARAFAPTPVYDLDDSGPPMEDPYLASCLQQEQAQLWGLDKTLLAECGSDCPDPTNYTLDATIHIVKKYPNVPFGLMDSVDDSVITVFFGFGLDNCTGIGVVSADQYKAGLEDERMKLAQYKNVGSYIFPGSQHTSLTMSSYDTQTVTVGAGDGGGDDGGGGTVVKLSDWVTTLVNTGVVTNVGLDD